MSLFLRSNTGAGRRKEKKKKTRGNRSNKGRMFENAYYLRKQKWFRGTTYKIQR